MSGDGDGVRERCEREGKIYLVVWGITGGVRGYTVDKVWVPWTRPQGCIVHYGLTGTDRFSHYDRGTVCTSTEVTALNASTVRSVMVSTYSQ